MEIGSIVEKGKEYIKRYKYAALILAIGLVLMLLPNSTPKVKVEKPVDTASERIEDIELRLGEILSQVEGAGNVDVLLTQSRGERVLYQTDSSQSENSDSSNHSYDTVLVTDSDKNESGLIVQTESPVYQGAIVLSQGANTPAIKLAIVDAVSKATGLGANQITVLKMK